MNKERDLSIQLLEAKIERLTGKKVVYVEKTTSKKPVLTEKKEVLKENYIIDLVNQAMQLLNDKTVVDIAGEAVQKGVALKAMLATLGLPAAAAVATYGKGLVQKGWTLAKLLAAKPKQQQAAPATNAPVQQNTQPVQQNTTTTTVPPQNKQ